MTWLRMVSVVAVFALAACSEPAKTTKLRPNPDLAGYQDGWRDAGFRLDPVDAAEDTIQYSLGWPAVGMLLRFENSLILGTVGGGIYRHEAGTQSFKYLRLPDGGRSWGMDISGSRLLVLSQRGNAQRLFVMDLRKEKWDSIDLPKVNAASVSWTIFSKSWTMFKTFGDSLLIGVQVLSCADSTEYNCSYSWKSYLMEVSSGDHQEILDKDTASHGVLAITMIDGKIIGKADLGRGWSSWNAKDTTWTSLPGVAEYDAIHPEKKIKITSGVSYRGAWYIGGYYGENFKFENGVWQAIPYPGVETSGLKQDEWGWVWKFHVINDTLWGAGSAISFFDPNGKIWEVAYSMESGPLPPGSYYASGNTGCFRMGDPAYIQKFGDTIYAGTMTGLWKIGFSRALKCGTDYSGTDACSEGMRRERCLDAEDYCCNYEHGEWRFCNMVSCPVGNASLPTSSEPTP